MALTRGNLTNAGKNIQFVPASTAAAIYINPATTKTYLKGFILFNGNTTTETINLYYIEDNLSAPDTLDIANKPQQFVRQELASGETFYVELNYPIVMTDQNDQIMGLTDTAQKVTVILLGDKE
tara:strand:- start:5899 stop:6270 length:372 start_codon:yes stop_codon:yes gene_type:complete